MGRKRGLAFGDLLTAEQGQAEAAIRFGRRILVGACGSIELRDADEIARIAALAVKIAAHAK